MLFDDAVILIIGGTGSLGSSLIQRMMTGSEGLPRKVIVMSRDEAKQHFMRQSYLNRQSLADDHVAHNFRRILEFRIGDIRNYADVCSALNGVDVVINAAALKQVPTCEYFPDQAFQTNCMGPQNVIRAIGELKLPVKIAVAISTDKACKPVNAMGMTKALQERMYAAANITIPSTRFVCVRFGNVLASRGSVIPLFREQIRRGGPVTVTDPSMTRFLLPLEQAVDTVCAALREAKPGELVVPDAPSATVLDIANAIIGDRDLAILTTGSRPGEKTHEILISEEELPSVERRGGFYYVSSRLPELRLDRPAFSPPLSRELSSADHILGPQATTELLRRHGFLMDEECLGDNKGNL